jgi:hypothetical protein
MFVVCGWRGHRLVRGHSGVAKRTTRASGLETDFRPTLDLHER